MIELRLTGEVPAEHLARLPEMLQTIAPTSLFPGEWPHRPGGYMPNRFEHSRTPRCGCRRCVLLRAQTRRRTMEQDL